MGKCTRNQMVRDRFIAAQRGCGLRRHLDSVPPDTPIRDIVDCCRVWESHSEQKKGSAPGAGLDQEIPGMSGDSREPGCPEVDSRIPVAVANVIQSDIGAPRRGGGRMQSGRPSGNHVLPDCTTVTGRSGGKSGRGEDAGAGSLSVVSEVGITGRSQLSEVEQVTVCFSCGRPGHGVNRRSRVDTSFPFLPHGWSVDIRDGQYRAIWPSWN